MSVQNSQLHPTRKPVVGLTGGIASGKSTVAGFLRDLGIGVVDADQVSKEVVSKGSEGLSDIVKAFGSEYLTSQGELDRERMGALVFADPQARQTLNNIVHPRVATRSAERIAELSLTNTPYVVYDVPLLVEAGLHTLMDAVVVVAAPQQTQVARVCMRDNLGEREAAARIAAQLPLEKKIEVADFVIHNDGTLDALRQRTSQVHQELVQRFAKRE